jgi:ABC-type antimicrobial peptide transport system permease subunit
MRALGFGSLAIAGAVIVESVLLGLVGGSLGGLSAYAIGDGMAASLLNPASSVPLSFEVAVAPQTFMQGLAASVLVGLIAAVPPAIAVVRMPIINGLRAA